MITIHYSAARCGAGKTRWACERIARNPGRYLLAVDRRDVFARRAETIEEFAAEHGTHPRIVQLYSKSEKWEGGISDVRRSVREAGCEYTSFPHIIVVITHEALKSSDLTTYTGWTLIIDEVPTVWTHEEICTPVLWKYLRQVYNIIPVGDSGWSEVQAKADGASVTDHHLDTYLAPMAVFHKRVKDQGVFAQLMDWQDAAGRKPWSWFSIWNLEELSAFETVYLLANAFEHTVTYKLLASASNTSVRFEPFDIPGAIPWLPREITIRYFAASHTAGTAFWTESDSGQECLRRIPWWVNAHSDAENHYWSCNLGLYPDNALIGKKVSPKIAGSNDYKGFTCGTFIYTAKPSRAEERVFDWFGISREEVIRSREFEDLVQMFWRCSVREAGDLRPVEFRVYDQQQAEFLRDFIIQAGLPATTVAVEQIDLGLDEFGPNPVGRPRQECSQQEIHAKAEQKKEQDRLRKAKQRARKREQDNQAGVERRSRGRPRKHQAHSAHT